jgi:hypothetical protein
MENKYEKTKSLSNANFKRLIGVTRKIFEEMAGILKEAFSEKHKTGGRTPKLSIENMLLLALEYWRQYVTFAELGFYYGVAESTAHDIVVWVENVLIKCGKFNLPGKKALLDDKNLKIVLLDVMESPIERPKKTKRILLREEEKTYNKNVNFCE